MAKSEKNKQGKLEAQPEVIQPLAVEIKFPNIFDLKQALAFDNEGALLIAIQFKAKVDQFECFRLVNLLKQPHGPLHATIGSPQSVMDFKFDAKEIRFEVFKAAAQLAAGDQKKVDAVKEAEKVKDKAQAAQAKDTPPKAPTGKIFTNIQSNHVPDDALPFGLFADVLVPGSELGKSTAGRGKTPAEAAISLLKQVDIIPTDRPVEPFEAIKYLTDDHGEDAYCLALADVIKSNSFEPLLKIPKPDQGTAAPPASTTDAAAQPKKRNRKGAGDNASKGD
jgi:hypothetical protein